MGLDMHLNGKRFLSKFCEESDDKRAAAIQSIFPELAHLSGRHGDVSPVNEVRIDLGYWRKANAIHQWFVNNVQGGEDECNPHIVSRNHLLELKDLCTRVIENPALASELLPTSAGFFFGSEEYNEYYFHTLRQTITSIDACLAMTNEWEFEYCSSW